MIRCPDNQINASFIDISCFFYCGRLSSAQLVPLQAPKHRPIISPRPVEQTAYKSNSSTETALLKVKSDIMSALDNQQAVFLVLLDLSAAFDTIDHSILLNRMSNVFGITGSVQKWFHSYLTDWTCKVKIATDFF